MIQFWLSGLEWVLLAMDSNQNTYCQTPYSAQGGSVLPLPVSSCQQAKAEGPGSCLTPLGQQQARLGRRSGALRASGPMWVREPKGRACDRAWRG